MVSEYEERIVIGSMAVSDSVLNSAAHCRFGSIVSSSSARFTRDRTALWDYLMGANLLLCSLLRTCRIFSVFKR